MMDATNIHISDLLDVRQQLNVSGITPTPQRLAIAEVLLTSHQHVTADEVFEKVNRSRVGPRVSKATVYNSLGLFVKKSLLREIFVDASRTFYDTNTQPHHHFYNLDTGQLIDMEERLVPFILESSLPENTLVEDIEIMIRVRNQKQ
ncbi:MAG: transcriptional repressor [Pseudomonadota bacterium]